VSVPTSLSGMTGFARLSGCVEATQWTWEIRSVNGRGLDVRVKLPPEFSSLEAKIRQASGHVFKRGNLQVNLTLQGMSSSQSYHVNETLFDKLSDFAKSKNEDVQAGQILAIPGVVDLVQTERSSEEIKILENAILSSFVSALQRLKSAREDEGKALAPILMQAVTSVESAIAQAQMISDALPAVLKSRIEDKLNALLAEKLDPARLAQEAALLAIKADVTEEIDRLKAHCADARKLLKMSAPTGRKLEFLAQEFNREINTLCSKSSDIELTRLGLEMKSYIEQFREQAANVQ